MLLVLALALAPLTAKAFEQGDRVTLFSPNGASEVWVWKDQRSMEKGAQIIAERLNRGDGIDPSWAFLMTNCIPPVGTEATVITHTGITTAIEILTGELDCVGEVLTQEIRPASPKAE